MKYLVMLSVLFIALSACAVFASPKVGEPVKINPNVGSIKLNKLENEKTTNTSSTGKIYEVSDFTGSTLSTEYIKLSDFRGK